MPVRATSSPKIALIKVDLPTPVLPKIARLNRPIAAFCFSYSVRNESRNQSVLPAIGPRVRGVSAEQAGPTLSDGDFKRDVERQRYGRSSGPLQMIWHRS